MNDTCGQEDARPDVEGRALGDIDWTLHVQPSGVLLVERNTQYYIRLSAAGAALALQLARLGGLDELVRVRAITERIDRDDARRACIADLSSHPVTQSWLGGALASGIRVTGSRDAYLPLLASLQLTNTCNLKCPFCYASSGMPLPGELRPDVWLDVITRLAAAGVMSVTLTGGEPMLVPGFREILVATSTQFAVVDVFTNGMCWTDDTVDLVASLGNVRCQVSLDGLESTHDEIRGVAGSFRRAIEAIEALSDRGVIVMIATTVTPRNHDEIGRLIDEVARAGALQFRSGGVQTVGRGVGDFGLADATRAGVASQLTAASVRNPGMFVADWGGCGSDWAGVPGLPVDFCSPGYLSWHVRADGWVTPCTIESARLGHIINEPVHTIGAPDRVATAKAAAQGCQCMARSKVPGRRAVLFEDNLRPARA